MNYKMKYLKHIFESVAPSEVRKINTSYDGVFNIQDRSHTDLYDIYYNGQNGWIFIGIYDSYTSKFWIWSRVEKISDYRPNVGPAFHDNLIWDSEFSEFAFDVFVNKWYDELDKLY